MDRKKTKHKGIYKVGKVYYITYHAQGKKHEKAVGVKLKRALDEKREIEEKAHKGKYAIIERMETTTFRELFNLYKEKGENKPYILKFEKAYLDHFGDRKLSSISRSDLFDFRDKVKKTPKQRGGAEVTDSTVNRSLAGLRRLFSFGIAKEYLENNPFPKDPKSGLFYSEKKGLRNFFTEAEMIKILDASPEWLRPMILTGYYTGMRASEMLGLRREHVDLGAGIIYLPSSKTLKDATGKGQQIVMQIGLINLFRSLPSTSEWLFTNQEGLPYNYWIIAKAFKKILKSVGIDTTKFSWKELRHTTGSLMHLKGVDPIAIKDQLRHSSVKTTERFYIGTDTEYQRAQAEKITLNDLPPS
jgi:integrase